MPPTLSAVRLARRPRKVSPGKDVGMKMRHRLTRLLAGIDNKPVTVGAKVKLLHDCADAGEKIFHQSHFLKRNFLDRGEMFLGYCEQMGRRFGVDVFENERFFVLIDFGAWDLACNDFAENAILHSGFLLS